jgi:hypothetical protein
VGLGSHFITELLTKAIVPASDELLGELGEIVRGYEIEGVRMAELDYQLTIGGAADDGK